MRSPLRNLARALILGPSVALLSCSGEDLVSPPTAGSIAITTTTTGPEPDPDGYAVSVNDGAEVGMGVNGTHQVNELPAGRSHRDGSVQHYMRANHGQRHGHRGHHRELIGSGRV